MLLLDDYFKINGLVARTDMTPIGSSHDNDHTSLL